MKQKILVPLIGVFVFLLIGTIQSFAQTTIYTEDFETVGPEVYFEDGQDAINGLEGWSYDLENGGRLRFDQVSNSGNYAALMDMTLGGDPVNYLILTIDLSEYDVKHDDIHVSFYQYDAGDEPNIGDRLWIRSTSTSANLEAMNLDGGAEATWVQHDVNLSDVLRANGENFTSTTQLIWAQEDNFAYTIDGRAFDDIEIYGYLGAHTNWISSAFVTPASSSCGKAADSVTLALTNNVGYAVNNVPVHVEVLFPDQTTTELNATYTGSIYDGETVQLNVGNINTQMTGMYMLRAISEKSGVVNAYGYTAFSTQEGAIEPIYNETFNTTTWSGYWALSNVTWSTLNGRLESAPVVPGAPARVTSPKLQLTDTSSTISFDIEILEGDLDVEDSILVQITNNCGAPYTTLDTITAADYPGFATTYSYRINQGVFNNDIVNIRLTGGKADINNTPSFTYYVNNFNLSNAYDVAITGIYTLPESNACNGFATDSIYVDIQNNTPGGYDRVPVEVQIRNVDTEELIDRFTSNVLLTQDLGGGQYYENRAFVGNINTLTPGSYGIYVAIKKNDLNEENNDIDYTTGLIGTSVAAELPAVATNFGDITNWSQTGLVNLGDSAYFSLVANGATGEIQTPLITASGTSTLHMAFRAAVDTIGGGAEAYYMGTGDSVFVEVSDDCGVNWTQIAVIDSAAYGTHQTFQLYNYDLSGYNGQSILARVVFKHEEPAGSEVTAFRPWLDFIKVLDAADHDVSAIELITSDKICGDPTDSIYVVLRNNGAATLTNISFDVDISHVSVNKTVSGNYTGSLAYGEVDTAFVLFSSELLGTYTFNAISTLATDNYTANDDIAPADNKTYVTGVTVPRYYNFDNPVTEWTYNGFTYNGNSYITNLVNGDVEDLITSRFSGIQSNYYLYFDYYVANNVGNDNISLEEVLYINVSDDCNNNFTKLDSISQATHIPTGANGEYRRVFFPLSAYTGDDILVQLLAEKTGATTFTNYSFVIDNLGISPFIDANILSLDVTGSDCGNVSDSVVVTVQNSGAENLTNVPVHLTMHFDNWDYEFEQTLASLNTGETVEVVFNGLNTTYKGDYSFTAWVDVEGDIVPGNNYETNNATTLDSESIPYFKGSAWNNGDWSQVNTFNLVTDYLQTNDLSDDQSATFTSMSIGELTATSKLSYQYWVYSNGEFGFTQTLGVGDTVKVKVSTDCGNTFQTIRELHAANVYDYGIWSWTVDTISLGQFAGENVIIQFEANKSAMMANSTDWFRFYLDNVNINDGYDVDIDFIDLVDPFCSSANDTIWVQVSNTGNYPVSNLPVQLSVETPNGALYDLFDTIPVIEPGMSDSAIFVLNTSDSVGVFNLTAQTLLDSDPTPASAVNTRTIIDSYYAPYLDNMDGGTNSWIANDFSVDNEKLFTEVGPGDFGVTYSPKLVPLTNISRFEFDYRVVGFNAANARVGNILEQGDSIKIWISTDCGETITSIASITQTNHMPTAEFQRFGVDLSAYVNQEIIVYISVENHQYNLDAAVDLRLELDNIAINNGIDVGISEIIRPSTITDCGYSNEEVSLVVSNYGTLSQSNIPVTLELYFADNDALVTSLNGILAGPLAPNSSDTIVVGNVNTDLAGTYEFHGFTSLQGDTIYGSHQNDHTDDVLLVQGIMPVGFTEAFDVNPGWSNRNMTYYWTGADWTMLSGNLQSGDTAIIDIPKFGEIEDGQYFSFELFAASDAADNELSEEDSIILQVSTDCGATYTTLLTIDSANYKYSGTAQIFYVDLSSYEGMNLNARIIGFKTPGMVVENDHFNYWLDDISVGIIDAGISNVEISAVHDGTCGTEEVPVSVTVYNYGNLPVSDIPVNVEFTFSGLDDYLLSFVIDTTLWQGQSLTFIADTINTTTEGDYHVDAYTTSVIDNNNGNNADSDDAYTAMQQVVPYYYWYNNTDENVVQFDTIEVVIPDKVGPVAANHTIGIEYYIEAENNDLVEIGNYLRTGDRIEILVSTDCGENYQVVHTIDMSNHHNQDYLAWSGEGLAAYVGQTVWSKVRFIKGGVGVADFHLEYFAIDYTDNAGIADVEWLTVNNNVFCGSSNDSVLVEITNYGINELTSIPVRVVMEFMGEFDSDYNRIDSVDVTYTGSLFNGQIDSVWAVGFNTQMPGDYIFEASTLLESDSIDNGVVLASGSFDIPFDVPYTQHFTTYADFFDDWYYEVNNGANVSVDVTAAGEGTLDIENARYGDSLVVITHPVGTIDDASSLQIQYLIEAWDLSGNFTGNYMRPDDEIRIIVSDRCSGFETLLHVINQGTLNDINHNGYALYTQSLADFAGEDIVVKLEINKGLIGEMDLFIDYLSISNPDVGVSELFTYHTYSEFHEVCGPQVDSLYARVTNFGLYDVANIPVVYSVNGTIEGNLTYSGTLYPGETDSLFLGTISSQAMDIMDIYAYTTLTTDINTVNDSSYYRVTRQPVAVPYRAFTKDWIDDNWDLYDMYRSGDHGVNSDMIGGVDDQVGIDSSRAISPLVTGISAQTYLVFDYEISEVEGLLTHVVLEEQLSVQVSTDCGVSFADVPFVNINHIDLDVDIDIVNSMYDNGTIYADLSAYDGQDIVIKVLFTTGRSDSYFYIDLVDIMVVDLPVHRPIIHQFNSNIVCNKSTYQLSTLGLPQAVSYNWVLTPPDAGSITGNGAVVNVTMNDEFYGPFTVTVQGLIYTQEGLLGDSWDDNGPQIYEATGYEFLNGYTYYTDGSIRSAFSLPTHLIADACLDVENTLSDNFEVYPNPTTGVVNFNLPENIDVYTVALVDAQGQVQYIDNNKLVNETLDLSGVAQGLYIIEVSTDTETYRSAIVVE